MKLYIAEKPSLGRAIASALPKPHNKKQGYIEVGNGDVVSWCIGHILEQAEPESYDSDYKKWQMKHLPIIPEQWQLKPKTKTRSQLTVLKKLVKKADELVHAGDPDREGQLLVDEVIDYLKVHKTKKMNTKRLLISDLNYSAVKRALSSIKLNKEFMPLSVSALARSRADWLYGINLTRAYTLQGQQTGFNGVLSVGRVQTPILGLVVRRDQEIEQFISHDYFNVYAHLITNKNEAFIAKWQPSKACKPFMDQQGRVILRSLADNVVARITDQPAEVETVKKEQKKQFAPLPYNLSGLQIDAAKKYSMNAKLVLDVCQSLYEKYKLITYPRSDCRYLPKEQLKQASTIIDHIKQHNATFSEHAKKTDLSITSKTWNNKQVKAHHAIIPTEKPVDLARLNSFEKSIYQLIVRQYLAQFFPPYIYDQTQLTLNIKGGVFTANAKSPQQIGWKILYKSSTNKSNGKTISTDNYNQTDKQKDKQTEEQTLPQLLKGDVLHCTSGEVLDKKTKPPQPYTDASLLSAMTGIARHVCDAKIKKILKETDGLGTEATRAGIIDLLFKRKFLQRIGKTITATAIGKSLINTLPESATLPDMTAEWEAKLNAISEKQTSYQSFMSALTDNLQKMVVQSTQQSFVNLPKTPFKKRKVKIKNKL